VKFSPLFYFFCAAPRACAVGNFSVRFSAGGAIYAADGAMSTVNSSKFDAVAAGDAKCGPTHARASAQNSSDGAMT
jgi:hypothetical protein